MDKVSVKKIVEVWIKMMKNYYFALNSQENSCQQEAYSQSSNNGKNNIKIFKDHIQKGKHYCLQKYLMVLYTNYRKTT